MTYDNIVNDTTMLTLVMEYQDTLNDLFAGQIVKLTSGIYANYYAKIDSIQLHTGYNPGWMFYLHLSMPNCDDDFSPTDLIVARRDQFKFIYENPQKFVDNPSAL